MRRSTCQAFAAWAAYCDENIDGEKRHTCNYVLDREQRAQSVLLEICGGSRTILFKSGGLWTPRPTRNTAPVQLLSWANTRNLKLTYTRDPDRINVLEARFANEQDQFQQDVLTWPTVDTWPADVRKASLEIRGVTKPSRIIRALQFELNRRRLELLSLTMDCALDAIVLQPHDVFRFAHPMPGWGTSGRVRAGSTVNTVLLDESITMEAGKQYHLYLRFYFDAVDVKPVINIGAGTYDRVHMAVPFAQQPEAEVTLWAFGESTPVDRAVKLFRVVHMQRKSDTTVSIQAIAHHPGIYDDPNAVALPPISSIFNPLGPPPPLTSLVATEVARVQTSGASLRAVDLSWDVAALTTGYGPYGGAAIYRRTVLLSGQMGQAQAGQAAAATIQDPADPNVNFTPLAQLRGHVLDYDDFTVITGTTYQYRVVPLSQRGVPNNLGAREAVVHVSGPTTGGFFPATVRNLRLRGLPAGVTTFEGRDVHIEWDPIADSTLFSTTFFILSYTVEVWAPGQLYLMRRTAVAAGAAGQAIQFTYTFQHNLEDQLAAGFALARRDLLFLVYANTNTGLTSLHPASLAVINPPPDMGDMEPAVTTLFEAALISFDQFVEPRDFDHYEVHLDTVNPPIAIYENVAVAFSGVGSSFRKIAPQGLTPGTTYYVYILPYDTFGPGIPTHTVGFVPAALTADSIDTTPPATPTGLTLTTGRDISSDGTVMPWVRASWNRAPENDVAGYEVHVFVAPSGGVPTVYNPTRNQFSIQFPVPGNLTVRVKLLAFDKFHNISGFTEEATITTSSDTVPPAVPTGATAFGSFRAIVLQWIPPSDLDYDVVEVWASFSNNLGTAGFVGFSAHTFIHEGLGTNVTLYYWLRARDTSGNVSPFTPGDFAGLVATTVATSSNDIGNLSITETKIANDSISTPKLQANSVDANKVTTGELITLGAQIRNAIIGDAHVTNLTASKLTAGNIQALVNVGVGNNIWLDGQQAQIVVWDNQAPQQYRVILGRLGALVDQWGLQIYGPTGALMWNFVTGATTAGISDASITATKIQAAIISATHLRTDTAVVTVAAQIANALIGTAHIQDAAITNAKIGDLQVTAAKIQNGNILNAHIGDAQITTAKIGDLAVDTAKINNLSVNGLKITDSAVDTPKITANAVSGTIQHVVNSQLIIADFNGEVLAGILTIGVLFSGDIVQLIGSCIVNTQNGNTMTFRLRLDNVTGAVICTRSMNQPGGQAPAWRLCMPCMGLPARRLTGRLS